MAGKTTTLSIRISTEMRRELDVLAEKNRQSVSDFVKQVLSENMTGERFRQARNELDSLNTSATGIESLTVKLSRLHRELLEKTRGRGDELLKVLDSVKADADSLAKQIAAVRSRERMEHLGTLIISATVLFLAGAGGMVAVRFFSGA